MPAYSALNPAGGSSTRSAGGGLGQYIADTARANRGQAILVGCVVLVLTAGALTTLKSKIFPDPELSTEMVEVGAPAITGAPSVNRTADTASLPDDVVDKKGAGLMFVSGGEVLLLKRSSAHNDQKWGLPGGNVEEGDKDLIDTAKREATEEMGTLPPFDVKGEILTVRGKSDQKHYTVFICTLTAQDKAAFKPQLNHEHSKWIWWPLDKAKSRKDLHPIVSKLFSSSTNLETVTRWAGLR